MPSISINDLRAGMVLRTNAVHHNGRVLLRAGTTLEQKHIKMFKTWGLVSADIDGLTQELVESELLSEMPAALIDSIQDELSSLFRHTDRSHPVISELYRLMLRRRAEEKIGDRFGAVDC